MKKVVLSVLLSTVIISGIGFNYYQNSKTNNSMNNQTVEVTKVIQDKEIFGIMETSSNWVKQPTPENLSYDSSSVVKIKVLSIGEAHFMDSLDYNRPLTPVRVQVLDVLSGDKLSDTLDIYTLGGDVKISEVVEHTSEEETNKMQLNTLTREQQSENYIRYSSEYDYNFNIDEEYVVILNKQPNNVYTVSANGYGIFKSKDTLEKSNLSYENVLTGDSFDFDK